MHNTFGDKNLIFLFIAFFLIIAEPFYGEPSADSKVALKVSGGTSYLTGTDYDASDWGWDYLRKVTMENQGGSYSWEQNVLDRGWEMNGEFLIYLDSRFALSGGVGYITGKSHSKGTTSLGGISTIDETDLKAKSVPVTLGATYFFPISPKTRISISGGVGYYFSSFSRNYLSADIGIYRIQSDFTGSASDFGFQGGIAVEFDLFKNIAIVIEGFGRYAKISGFEGTRNRLDSNNWSDSLEVKYYYSDRQHSSGELLPRVNLSDPSTIENAINIRDYESDFSGFTLRFGLKIDLF